MFTENNKCNRRRSTVYFGVRGLYNSLEIIISFFLQRGLIGIFLLAAGKLFAQNPENKLPSTFHEAIGFIENNGQIHDQFQKPNNEVKFLLPAKGLNVQLKKNSFSYDTYEVMKKSVSPRKNFTATETIKKDPTMFKFHRVDIEFIDANPSPQIFSEEQLEGRLRYFSPAKPDGISAHQFRRVVYKELYPGIDLVFDTRNVDGKKGFEYYFVVKPGADPQRIKLRYKGANTQLKNNRIGIQLVNGTMEESIPASFICTKSTVDFSQLKQEEKINVSYKSIGVGVYGFKVPKYDRTKTLIIDPTPDLVWGTYYGGYLNDWAYNIAKDPAGNIIVCGSSNNPGFATAGAYQTILNGFADAMLGKFLSNGSLVWMTYFGGEWEELAYGVCTDNSGNIFIAGITDSKTGVSTPGSHQTSHGNSAYGRDAFIAKFNAAGNRIWSTYYGGSEVDYIMGIRCDVNGNLFIAGWTYSSNNIATPGSFQPAYGSGPGIGDQGDGFVARFDNNGNRMWATYYGGLTTDSFTDLAIDNTGNCIYAAGGARSPNLGTPGVFQPSPLGDNAILVKFDMNGNRIWASYFGGSGFEYPESITCDNQGNPIMAGISTSSTGITTPGCHQPTFNGGGRDGLVVKFNGNGNRLWATYYGGVGEEWIYGISNDANNNLIITGSSSSSTHIATANAYQSSLMSPTGRSTCFIAKLNANGARIWGTYYGYGNPFWNGEARHSVSDNAGNVFVCGVTLAPNGISTCNAVQQNWSANQDMFVAMFSETIIPLTVSVTITADQPNGICAGSPLTFTSITVNGGTNPLYQWKVNGTNAGTNSSTFTTTSLNHGDQVSCTVTSNSPCITNPIAHSNVVTASINPSVVPALTIVSDKSGSICSGAQVTFTAQPVNEGRTPTYQWKINGVNAGTNSSTFSTISLVDGDAVSCVLTNPLSCNPVTSAISNSITVDISAVILPSISIISSASSVCKGEPLTFTASSLNAGSNPSYKWKVNGNVVGAGLTYTNTNLLAGDTVQCVLEPDNVACISSGVFASNAIITQVFPLPDFTIQPGNPVIAKGDTVQLIATGANIANYKWTPAQNINNDAISSPKVWPASTTTYTLETTSPQGCLVSKDIIVTVITDIRIPNAFTPNNDRKNDTWAIKGLELYPNCSVRVFNRWGQIVYQSHGYPIPWNGTFKGVLQDVGTYVYFIDLKNGTKPLKGTIMIIR